MSAPISPGAFRKSRDRILTGESLSLPDQRSLLQLTTLFLTTGMLHGLATLGVLTAEVGGPPIWACGLP